MPKSPDAGGYYPESRPAIDEITRLEFLAELSAAREQVIHWIASERIARDPELATLMGWLVECSQEAQPDIRDHVRRMIALHLGLLSRAAQEAAEDAAFYSHAASDVQVELDELAGFTSLEDLPDLWDVAYQDLFRFEGGW